MLKVRILVVKLLVDSKCILHFLLLFIYFVFPRKELKLNFIRTHFIASDRHLFVYGSESKGSLLYTSGGTYSKVISHKVLNNSA